ncbi:MULTISPECIES: Hha/YmoA family nucleoid-associated regulatory protein [Enterobacteriaceae]|uniref:Hha/YmoA family nucleoid-associated regulatory protein n=1 Tax=Enterobacteriaceae TaxID=543 RepID=UPI0035319319
MKSVTIEAKAFAEMLGITEGELFFAIKTTGKFKNKTIPQPHTPHKSKNRFLYSDVVKFIESIKQKENLHKTYLMRFRRCRSLDTLEKVFESLREKLTGNELDAMMSASDHRRAEIAHNTLWDKVPASAWRNVK